MTYTPVELRHVRVGRSLLGYKRAAVDELIVEIAESFETTWRERGELSDRVESLEKETAELRRREELLSHTLVAAEQTARDLRDQAGREADVIVGEARQQARAVLRAADDTHERLLLETRRIEALLRSALALVDEQRTAPRLEPDATAAAPAKDAVAPVVPEPRAGAPAAPGPWPAPGEVPTPAAGPPDERVPEPPAPPEPPASEGGDHGWLPDDTGELPRVELPPVEPGGAGPGQAEQPVLRPVAGGLGHEFDWGE